MKRYAYLIAFFLALQAPWHSCLFIYRTKWFIYIIHDCVFTSNYILTDLFQVISQKITHKIVLSVTDVTLFYFSPSKLKTYLTCLLTDTFWDCFRPYPVISMNNIQLEYIVYSKISSTLSDVGMSCHSVDEQTSKFKLIAPNLSCNHICILIR